MELRTLVFEWQDGHQVQVDLWPIGPATAAERSDSSEVFGPPVDAYSDRSRETLG